MVKAILQYYCFVVGLEVIVAEVVVMVEVVKKKDLNCEPNADRISGQQIEKHNTGHKHQFVSECYIITCYIWEYII